MPKIKKENSLSPKGKPMFYIPQGALVADASDFENPFASSQNNKFNPFSGEYLEGKADAVRAMISEFERFDMGNVVGTSQLPDTLKGTQQFYQFLKNYAEETGVVVTFRSIYPVVRAMGCGSETIDYGTPMRVCVVPRWFRKNDQLTPEEKRLYNDYRKLSRGASMSKPNFITFKVDMEVTCKVFYRGHGARTMITKFRNSDNRTDFLINFKDSNPVGLMDRDMFSISLRKTINNTEPRSQPQITRNSEYFLINLINKRD